MRPSASLDSREAFSCRDCSVTAPCRSFLASAICVLAILCPTIALAQGPQIVPGVTAIDILLDPDEEMISRARAVNDRLRIDYPAGFALDADHAPHVTVVQAFVRTAELDKVYAAVAKVLKGENPTTWKLKATGHYDIPLENLGLAGIVIEPTKDLLRLQQAFVDAISPYISDKPSRAGFVPRTDGEAISQPTIDYVAGFVPAHTGKKYSPHVTVGFGTRGYLDKLKAEPFTSFTFKSSSVSVYQLGEFGTAQKLLWNSAPDDPLPSWSDGKARKSIVDFVAKVTKPGSADFVPVAERIATFDNDGTLWCEKPMPVQLYFALDRVKTLAPQHPEWKDKEPFASLLKDDVEAALAGGGHALLDIIMATHAGMTTEEFEQIVKDWIATAKHPTTGRLYSEMVYQPMLELLAYLRANGFKTFIVSGGGIEFMRAWAEQVYGIPPEYIVGSSIKTKFELRDGKPVLVRLPELMFNDDKEGKPVAINQHIGRKPLLAAGNERSGGDIAMLRYSQSRTGASLQLLVEHNDDAREFSYDEPDNASLNAAAASGWAVVDMRQDWKAVFAADKK